MGPRIWKPETETTLVIALSGAARVIVIQQAESSADELRCKLHGLKAIIPTIASSLLVASCEARRAFLDH